MPKRLYLLNKSQVESAFQMPQILFIYIGACILLLLPISLTLINGILDDPFHAAPEVHVER